MVKTYILDCWSNNLTISIMVVIVKALVTYFSRTGNTEKIANTIYEELTVPRDIIRIEQVSSPTEYDLVFVGSPIEKHGLVEIVKSFIKKIDSKTKIVLFITHAAPEQSGFANSYVEAGKNLFEDTSNLLGVFNCQGELSSDLAAHMLKSSNPQLQKFAEMRQYTLNQPDEERIERCKQFVKTMQEHVSILDLVNTS